jgi:hypothetical protein
MIPKEPYEWGKPTIFNLVKFWATLPELVAQLGFFIKYSGFMLLN